MHYYFDDEKCTKFYFSDVKGKPCHHTSPYNYSETDYWLSIAGNKEFQIIQPPKDGYLYVLQILGISNNGSITYGQSVYKQMTDEELKDMREQYNTEVIH